MSAVDACTVAAGHDKVHRYVAGTLSRDELDEFEPHLLGCTTCQALVREGLALRAVLAHPAAPARRGPRRWWLGAVPAAAALAALFVAARPRDPLARLAHVGEPPAFTGQAVRDGSDSATSFADRGIAAYAQGHWTEAADQLGRARGEITPSLRFYHGMALLLSQQAERALAPLAAAAVGAYAGDARLYRAKAWLALGNADSALVDLDHASVTGGAAAAHAAALADSIRAAIGR